MNCLLWTSVTVLSLILAVGGQLSGELRLVGNFSRTGGSSGRLEVYYNGRWGAVCNDRFGINDARVACRQLGFSTYTRYGTVGRLGFSQASLSTRIWLDELRCRGSESRLINCPANAIGVENCFHSEDIALSCTGTFSYSIGLGVTIPIIIIIVVIFVLVCVLINRRRRVARYPRSTPLITALNTQDTAYPVHQPMDQTPPYSPPQNMQPVAVYPTGHHADPQYHTSYPQQPPAQYYTSYPQQPPAQYYTSYPQQPPVPYPSGEQPPPAQHPTGQPPPAPLYGGEAPPAYPN